MGFAQRTSASLVAARNPRGTCRSSTCTSQIDFFFVHNEMAAGIQSVTVIEEAGTAPHLPVRIVFRPRLTSARSLVLRRPPRMGTERVFGPIPAPPCWAAVQRAAADILADVRRPDFIIDEGFRERYSAMYVAWSDMAEQEVINATGHEVQVCKTGLRGRPPALVWRSVQAERPPPPPEHHLLLNRWRTLASVVHELRGVLWWLHPLDPASARIARDRTSCTGPPAVGTDGRAGVPDLLTKIEGIKAQINDYVGDVDGFQAQARQGAALRGDADEDDAWSTTRSMARRIAALASGIEMATRIGCADDGRRSAQGRPSDTVVRLIEAAGALHDETQAGLDAAAAAHRAAKIDAWRQWVAENLANGARNAHKYLRLPAEWRPTTTLSVDGIVTADPRELLASYARKYDGLWNGDKRERDQRRREVREAQARIGVAVGPRGDDADGAALPPWRIGKSLPLARPSLAELKATAMTFRKDTLVAYDGFAMRQYCLLSDDALGIVADVIEVLETTGELPGQLSLTELPLIEKARGGAQSGGFAGGIVSAVDQAQEADSCSLGGEARPPLPSGGEGAQPADGHLATGQPCRGRGRSRAAFGNIAVGPSCILRVH